MKRREIVITIIIGIVLTGVGIGATKYYGDQSTDKIITELQNIDPIISTPQAVINGPNIATVNTEVKFVGEESIGNIESYDWYVDNKDNLIESKSAFTHVFSQTGDYDIILEVTDYDGNSADRRVNLEIIAKKSITIPDDAADMVQKELKFFPGWSNYPRSPIDLDNSKLVYTTSESNPGVLEIEYFIKSNDVKQEFPLAASVVVYHRDLNSCSPEFGNHYVDCTLKTIDGKSKVKSSMGFGRDGDNPIILDSDGKGYKKITIYNIEPNRYEMTFALFYDGPYFPTLAQTAPIYGQGAHVVIP